MAQLRFSAFLFKSCQYDSGRLGRRDSIIADESVELGPVELEDVEEEIKESAVKVP